MYTAYQNVILLAPTSPCRNLKSPVMTLTGKPVKQERNVNTKQINQRIPQYLYLLRSHRSNDEPASQSSGNEQVRSKEKPWRWSPPYNMRTWTANNTNLPWWKKNASTSEKSATSEETEIWELHYETIPNSESSELLLTIKVKILQTRNIETNQLK